MGELAEVEPWAESLLSVEEREEWPGEGAGRGGALPAVHAPREENPLLLPDIWLTREGWGRDAPRAREVGGWARGR